ncbi:MAG: hypothetical protein AB8B82_08045 [Roseovarius sp.]
MIRLLAVIILSLSWATIADADPRQDWIEAQKREHRPVLSNILADAQYQTLATLCPADVFAQDARRSTGSAECRKNPGWCLIKCRGGQGKACFGVARAIQTEMEDVGEATFTYPMFMAACAIGHANGCTNAGAAVKNGSWIAGTRPDHVADRACQFRTYDAACTAGASWGCFMLGLEWGVEGVNGQTDQQKAKAAWQRSCVLGPNGSACAASERRLSQDQ